LRPPPFSDFDALPRHASGVLSALVVPLLRRYAHFINDPSETSHGAHDSGGSRAAP
jgi:hypothetical protein